MSEVTMPAGARQRGGGGWAALAVAIAVGLAGCTSRGAGVREPDEAPAFEPGPRGEVQRGKASWYGGRFHGRKTASGERFDQDAMTAAHRKLRFGTRVEVTNLKNGRTVIVRINDRGPYGRGRVIDLSRGAARRIDMIEAGVVPVEVRVVSRPPPR